MHTQSHFHDDVDAAVDAHTVCHSPLTAPASGACHACGCGGQAYALGVSPLELGRYAVVAARTTRTIGEVGRVSKLADPVMSQLGGIVLLWGVAKLSEHRPIGMQVSTPVGRHNAWLASSTAPLSIYVSRWEAIPPLHEQLRGQEHTRNVRPTLTARGKSRQAEGRRKAWAAAGTERASTRPPRSCAPNSPAAPPARLRAPPARLRL